MAANALHEPGWHEGGKQRHRRGREQLEQRHKQSYLQENLLKCYTEAGGIVEDKGRRHKTPFTILDPYHFTAPQFSHNRLIAAGMAAATSGFVTDNPVDSSYSATLQC